MSLREFELSTIKDEAVTENFQYLIEDLGDNLLVRGNYKLYDIEVPAAGTYSIPNELRFTPNIILIAWDTASTTVNYNLTDKDTISYTTTSSGDLRLIVGRYTEGQGA